MSLKTAALLINLGTPSGPAPAEVRAYLREFLSDPRVIDVPWPIRWLLLNTVILPFRPKLSAQAYQKIWTKEGSPLRVHTRNLADKVQKNLGHAYEIGYAMRYGNPSIADALRNIMRHPIEKLIVFPLYPQYSSSAVGSSVEKVLKTLETFWNIPPIRVVPPFYGSDKFIDGFRRRGKAEMKTIKPDHVLFSFHGLPERHIRKSAQGKDVCLTKDDSCCARISEKNAYCYRAQCFETARHLARELELSKSSYTVCFQSRLGRMPWIKPYTDHVLIDLAKRKHKKILVFCPSFVADCLETLEEIAIRGRESFISHGGEELRLAPSLNDESYWVETVSDMIRKESGE